MFEKSSKRTRPLHHRRWVAGAAGLAAAASLPLIAAGCNETTRATAAENPTEGATTTRNSESPGVSTPRVETVRVERKDLSRTVEMPGTVEGYETADLYAKVGGYLGSIVVDIGDEVHKGQELAKLWVPELKNEVTRKQAAIRQAESEVAQASAAVTQAEAGLTAARAAEVEAKTGLAEHQAKVRFQQLEHQRFSRLAAQQSIELQVADEAKYKLEAAEAAVAAAEARVHTATAQAEAAKANVARAEADRTSAQANVAVMQADADHAETMLAYALVRAPFDGVILRRNVDAGAFIRAGEQAGSPLLTIARVDKVRVVVDVPMADARLLDRGDRAVLTRLTGRPGETFEGHVSRFAPAVDKTSRLAKVEVDLDNRGRKLLPGYYGYMTIHLEEATDVPVVPASALLSDAEGPYVFVVEDGSARRQPVKITHQDGTTVGVGSGLSGGEEVIRSGGGQVVPGQKVVPVLAQK
ncbi:MAG: efflux RND transporter periplasmic adaptor subunit [Planctomycetota bacterium]|nr:efflux RND transporter periplasmic adaptor subunit [Planctomycetaceae bacterium]MDQ3329962.1 efflux RND transporter periplasmic adaptor subunit [Planctomycetota bacterium]